jgi:gas vesicle protein
MKICTKCNIEKNESEFFKDKGKKDGLRCECKECFKQYLIKNKDKISKQKKEYSKDYLIINKDKISKQKKEYYNKNKDEVSKQHKQYRIENKDKIKKINKTYQEQRRKKDPCFKLRQNISIIINQSLRRKDSSKCGESILKYLPYSFEEFRSHIESQWKDWMNWENYGMINNSKRTWNIDHIIPQSALPYKSMEDENFQKCWALENLRPLEAIENLIKSNKLISYT